MATRLHPLSDRMGKWVINSVNPKATIESVHTLLGATSSRLYSIMLRVGTQSQHLVLREFHNTSWLLDEPDLAQHEAESLLWAARTGLPVPALIAFDASGETCGKPAVLMSWLEGKIILKPQNIESWLQGLAKTLVQIHKVEAADFPWNYFSYNDIATLRAPSWSQVPKIWELALQQVKNPPPPYQPSFIHRDYHPANVLWHDNKVSGVVDWTNACRGAAGIDIGHCRWNLAMLYDIPTADAFLTAYVKCTDTAFMHHPYWDILAVINTLSGVPTVYKGWKDFGITGLTDAMMLERTDAYMVNLVGKI